MPIAKLRYQTRAFTSVQKAPTNRQVANRQVPGARVLAEAVGYLPVHT